MSAVLWTLIVLCAVAAVRAAGDARRAAQEIAPRAVTPEQERANAAARELARAFAVEWATWTGDEKEYRERLSRFLRGLPEGIAPAGVQQVVAASVVGERAEGQTDGTRRIPVLLHVRRLVPAGEKDGEAWREMLLPVNVPVAVRDGAALAAGLPALAPMPLAAAAPEHPRLAEAAPAQLASFLRQFLALYYAGGEIANFVTPDSGIVPLGGWRLDAVGEIRVDDAAEPSLALVRVRVSGEGAARLLQELLVELRKERGRFLVDGMS